MRRAHPAKTPQVVSCTHTRSPAPAVNCWPLNMLLNRDCRGAAGTSDERPRNAVYRTLHAWQGTRSGSMSFQTSWPSAHILAQDTVRWTQPCHCTTARSCAGCSGAAAFLKVHTAIAGAPFAAVRPLAIAILLSAREGRPEKVPPAVHATQLLSTTARMTGHMRPRAVIRTCRQARMFGQLHKSPQSCRRRERQTVVCAQVEQVHVRPAGVVELAENVLVQLHGPTVDGGRPRQSGIGRLQRRCKAQVAKVRVRARVRASGKWWVRGESPGSGCPAPDTKPSCCASTSNLARQPPARSEPRCTRRGPARRWRRRTAAARQPGAEGRSARQHACAAEHIIMSRPGQ